MDGRLMSGNVLALGAGLATYLCELALLLFIALLMAAIARAIALLLVTAMHL
jgi:hypothetical protein